MDYKCWILLYEKEFCSNLIKQCHLTVYLVNKEVLATYSSILLQTIGKMAMLVSNYHLFSLDNTLRSKVIALGIRKQRNYKPYRRSREGRFTFHKISTVINQLENWGHLNNFCSKMSWTVDHRNILPVQLDNTKTKPTCMSLTHSALINCRSIINKSADFQVELVHNKVDICSLIETWIREDDTTTVSQICPPGYKAISVPKIKQTGSRNCCGLQRFHHDQEKQHMITYQWNAQTLWYPYLAYHSTWQSSTDPLTNQFLALPMTFWTIWRGTSIHQVNCYSHVILTFM